MLRRIAILLSLAVSATVAALHLQVDVRNVPVDRVAANLERELDGKPKDVGILVNLARVHAMAFAQKRDTVPSAVPMGLKPAWEITPYLGQGVPTHTQAEVRSSSDPKVEAAARAQLDKAIARYREALAVDPTHLVAKLGLGWTLIQAGDRAGAIAALRDVVARSLPADRKDVNVEHGQRSLTEEAVRYLIPLLDVEGDRDEIEMLRKNAAELARIGRYITPIAVPLEDGLTAIDIEDGRASVVFDADGSGLPKRWTWIRSNAAWLVFDRHREGRITSGLQLFGSVTFWLFWDNGYDALRSLDDDGDSSLAGRELDGLALWRDRNANGLSERGEVRPVADWGVTSLSTRYEHDFAHPDEIAFSVEGVTFKNGAVRPTYDVLLRRTAIAR